MANKFQQSVKERLDAEAMRQKSMQGREEPEVPVPEVISAPAGEAQPVADVSAYVRQTAQRVAKNKTFYLDAKVIDALRRAARAQRVTDSKLVNDILRNVLGISE